MKEITIIYASSTGNTLCVSEFIVRKLEAADLTAEIHNADIYDPDSLNDLALCIFATSTWEHGVIHPFFNKIIGSLVEKDLTKMSCAFVGTGDRRYEPILFCGGMETLREKVLERGAKELLSPLRIDGDPRLVLDSIAKNWCNKFIEIVRAE